jgi:hypothetical protein
MKNVSSLTCFRLVDYQLIANCRIFCENILCISPVRNGQGEGGRLKKYN